MCKSVQQKLGHTTVEVDEVIEVAEVTEVIEAAEVISLHEKSLQRNSESSKLLN